MTDKLKNEAAERIYLQLCDDSMSEWCGEVTWCEDRVHDEDVEYVRADVVERLRAELAEAKRVRDNCTLVPTDKLKEMQAELAAIKGQIADPSWVCLEGMSASELAAFDYGNKCCMDALRRILDGEDKGVGTCNEPWESLRRRVLVVASVADKDAELPLKTTPAIREALRTGSRKDYPSDELCEVRWAAIRAAMAKEKQS